MYNDLIKVVITTLELGIPSTIIIDNIKKDVSLNDKYNNLNIKDYNSFLSTFFRIIRNWENEEVKKIYDFAINIKIIEKDNEYNLIINNMPLNYDSFMDLISKLK